MANMRLENTVEELLESACPSIQYRIRHEILDEPVTTDKMTALQGQILEDTAVKEILKTQSPDGWLGQRFHGYVSLEAGLRLLCEKGVSPEHHVIVRALQALETNIDRIVVNEMGKVGKALDDQGMGGVFMMRATVFAYAGEEDHPQVKEQIEFALQGLEAVLKVRSLDEITETYRGKTVFREGVVWPSIYYLRLLAFTHNWRNPQQMKMVTEAIQRLVRLSPIPLIYVRHRSQIMAPASFAMQDFNPKVDTMSAEQWMMWFHRMELLARLGVVEAIPELSGQLECLKTILARGNGWFNLPINHLYFKQWGAYTGLMLEQNWKRAQRRVYDLTFRSLLILHYAQL